MMMSHIRKLTSGEGWRYRDHLLGLAAEDRRLRFGHPIDDDSVRRFVAALDPARFAVFVVDDPADGVVAAALVAVHGAAAELAFSVSDGHRRRGHARALFHHALLWARNRGIGEIHIACAAGNRAMRALARDMRMSGSVAAGEAEASLTLPPPSPLSLWREWAGEAIAARRRAWRSAMPKWRLAGSPAGG